MPGRFIRYLKGYVYLRIDSPLPERFLNLCAYHRILMWGLVPNGDFYEMYMGLQDFFRLREIVRKTRTKVTVLGHYGMPFFFQKYRSRKIFAISVLICLAFIYCLTLFIWQIEVTGLVRHDSSEILAFLQEEDVRYGMRKSRVDCEMIESDIRARFPDIVWVGASLEGTNLHIQIKENVDSYEEELPKDGTSDLVADASGTVVSMVTRTGTPMVAVGDQVEKGQVLISGREERKDDAGTVTGYTEGRADGDITVQTVLPYSDAFSYEHQVKRYTKKKQYHLTVRLFQKEAELLKKKPKFTLYDTQTLDRTVVLGKSFYLPVSYRLVTMREYVRETKQYSKAEAKKLANQNFQSFVKDLGKKGVEIIENSVKIVLKEKECVTSGELIVTQPAGTEAPLSPMETNIPMEADE